MPQCTICSHPQREEIDRALVDGRSLRHIAAQYGLTSSSLFRHRKCHLPAHLARSKHAEIIASADSILAAVEDLRKRIMLIFDQAEQVHDWTLALSASREARSVLQLLAEVSGELPRNSQYAVEVNNTVPTGNGKGLNAFARSKPMVRAILNRAALKHGLPPPYPEHER